MDPLHPSQIDILVVEDSVTQAAHLRHILEQNEYRVTVVSSGQAALTHLEKHDPAIVITDVIMPGLDGYELCRKIKTTERLEDIVVILLTRLSEPEDIIRGLECGADQFNIKPIDQASLMAGIQYIMTSRLLRKQHKIPELSLEFFFGDHEYTITSERMQILNLLIETYHNAVEKNHELEHTNHELKDALSTIKALGKLIVDTKNGPTKPHSSLNGRNILVVEDSRTQAERLQYLLERQGARPHVTYNGREGLEAARQHTPDLVITDVVMPDMSGYDLCRALKDHPTLKHTPVILLTTLSDPKDIIQGLRAGADSYLTKPYDDNYLLARVQSALAAPMRADAEKEEIEVTIEGKPQIIRSDRQQILNLLLTTYEHTVRQNQELLKVQQELQRLNESLEAIVQERTAALKAEVAERERAEEAYRAIIENATYGIFRATLDGHFLQVNPALVAMLGYASSEDLLEVNLSTDVFQETQAFIQMINRLGEKGRIKDIEFEWKRQDSALLFVRLSGRLYHDADANESRFEMFVEDITERRKLETQLRQSQKMEAVGQLAGGVAHDFNNLLTVIIGSAELLLMRMAPGDRMYKEITNIKNAGERAGGLTRQLLAFSRRQVLQPQEVDLNTVVQDMEKMLRRLIGEDIDLETFLEPALGGVKVDQGQIEQVIMNLAVNARDAMPGGGRLILETANIDLDEHHTRMYADVEPGPHVMVAVTDTGCGMDAETRAHIFEPFFTTKEQGKGTGLGLSTVYGIVKQSGGHIWVYSEPGRGTVFKIYLPRIETRQTARKGHQGQTGLPRGTETILLIEDEEEVRGLASLILQQQGYTVLDASRGNEAIEKIQAYGGTVHLIITDMVMPDMSGPQAVERLSGLYPDASVLYMSGYTDHTVVHHEALKSDAAFLQKPFTPMSLANKVRAVLDDNEAEL